MSVSTWTHLARRRGARQRTTRRSPAAGCRRGDRRSSRPIWNRSSSLPFARITRTASRACSGDSPRSRIVPRTSSDHGRSSSPTGSTDHPTSYRVPRTPRTGHGPTPSSAMTPPPCVDERFLPLAAALRRPRRRSGGEMAWPNLSERASRSQGVLGVVNSRTPRGRDGCRRPRRARRLVGEWGAVAPSKSSRVRWRCTVGAVTPM